ncbi:MAG: ribosome silencing factor [Lachnospiraceae bacterium]|nr:ribosome silencing factor [Lachnospiraceae bacterium]MDY6352329.1 ribosome silencing factor [Lachnospiraceae bacterium]
MNNTLEIVKTIKEALEDKKGEDIDILDISGVTVVGDYFVVASADNLVQLSAMKDEVEERLYKDYKLSPKNVEGKRGSSWILIDYGDVIVHLFTREDRAFYDLERIWKDGRRVEV